MSSVPSSDSVTQPIPVVGILGGVGSGKSTVIRHVTGLKPFVIDADRLAHELLATPEITQLVCAAFGSRVLSPDGTVDRKRLADLVFGDSAAVQGARQQLEVILHPAVRRETERRIQTVPHDADVIILDAALLLEAGWAPRCDSLIFVDTPLAVRRSRVLASRNWAPEELERRESAQWSVDRKKSHAEFIVDNSGSLENASQQIESCLHQIINRHPRP